MDALTKAADRIAHQADMAEAAIQTAKTLANASEARLLGVRARGLRDAERIVRDLIAESAQEPTEADLDAEQDAADRSIAAILDAAQRPGREIAHWKVPAELGDGDVEVRVVYDDDSTATYRTVDGRPELLS